MFYWAANGARKASEDHKGISEAICTYGHDCKIFVLDYLNMERNSCCHSGCIIAHL